MSCFSAMSEWLWEKFKRRGFPVPRLWLFGYHPAWVNTLQYSIHKGWQVHCNIFMVDTSCLSPEGNIQLVMDGISGCNDRRGKSGCFPARHGPFWPQFNVTVPLQNTDASSRPRQTNAINFTHYYVFNGLSVLTHGHDSVILDDSYLPTSTGKQYTVSQQNRTKWLHLLKITIYSNLLASQPEKIIILHLLLTTREFLLSNGRVGGQLRS